MQSSVTFQVQSGVELRIAVAGKLAGGVNQQGVVTLTVNGPPPSDNLAAATPFATGTAVTGMNFAAGKESGEPGHCWNQGGASVWYKWSSNRTAAATVSTTAPSFGNRCVTVYSGSAAAPSMASLVHEAGGTWATPDDTWNATFTPDPAKTYYIVVDGMSSEEPGYDAPAHGAFSITINQ